MGLEALDLALRRPQFHGLQVLNMKMNPSIGSNIAQLCQQLQVDTLPSLTDLNLSDCNLNIQGGIIMSRAFPYMTALRNLNLNHCKIELVSLAGIPGKSIGLACFTSLRILELAGNSLIHGDVDVSQGTGASKSGFFDDLARLTSLERLNLENCRLQFAGIHCLATQCLSALSNLACLNVSVNGLVALSDDEGALDDCFIELANGIRHLKKLSSIKLNQGGFSRTVARALCAAMATLPRPIYTYVTSFVYCLFVTSCAGTRTTAGKRLRSKAQSQ